MKKALVLAGGGTRGAYQSGAIQAFIEMGQDNWDIITGTSVGALNAALVVQKDYDVLHDLYANLSVEQIINGITPADISFKTILTDREGITKEFVQYLKDRGLDISPFISRVIELYNPEKFFASDVDFGCIVATHHGHQPVYVTKEMMKENGADWLIASASAYPAFPIKVIEDNSYVDGGYFDNCPIDFALQLGANEVVVLDLNHVPNHPQYINRSNVTYIFPKSETGDFLDFSKERIERLYISGYRDVYKTCGKYVGYKYTFEPYIRPAFFKAWYRDMELLETQVKLASNINNTLRSDTFLTDHLKQRMSLSYLDDNAYWNGMVDMVMDLLDMNEMDIYTLDDLKRKLHDEFDAYTQEDFNYKLPVNIRDIPQISQVLNTKIFVGRYIHTTLYPEHTLLHDSVSLTMHPVEKAMAQFITYLLKEKVYE